MDSKRAVRALWLILLLLTLCAIAQAAPEHMPYDVSLCLSYQTLGSNQQVLFDQLYDALFCGETEITLPDGTRYDDALLVMHTLLRDCPELCAVDNTFTLRYYRSSPEEAYGVSVCYALPLETQTLLLQTATEAACREGDPFAREETLHTLLCNGVTYDAAAPNPYSAYGALCEGRAVCEGYAEAMALLCRLSGIGCSVVSGSYSPPSQMPVPHSWNMVRLDDACAWVDVTLDDQQETAFYYFNLTDAQLCADHTPDESREGLPACDAPHINWHARHGLLAPDDEASLRTFMAARFRALFENKCPQSLRFSGTKAYEAALSSMEDMLTAWAMVERNSASGTSYAIITVPSQHCLTLLP